MLEVIKIKRVNFDISLPIKGMQKGKKYKVELNDDATFLEALAMVDKQELENPQGSLFPINEGYIHNYLQLFVNLEDNYIYDDVGIYAYGPDENGLMRKFNPIRDNVEFNVYPDSVIQLQPDVGC
ncbi:MAG: hypothetical protein EU532_00970 [Promethearchaeota archaeon]|nr:MAG: hypothetical protein EU532_00970 [Candidatus Lokiarchaeota archaeon]